MVQITDEAMNDSRRVRSARSAFLIDGAAYFAALHDALGRATRQIIILAWDLHSQVRLVRGSEARNDEADVLGGRLRRSLSKSKDLHIYVLEWDYAALFMAEREWVPRFALPWSRRRRLRFEKDAELPAGASHHQKIVVIDDAVAFCGGLDLTHNRWDTPEHLKCHPDRVTPAGEAYEPFHDIQAVVAGEAAAMLGRIARQRWKRATGESLDAPPTLDWQARWPDGVSGSFDDVPVAVARTQAGYADFPAIDEVEKTYLEQIRLAERYLYFENQYLTSDAIVSALCARLEMANGPEIVIVLPREASGWLEETLMGEGRDRSVARLRSADAYGQLRVLYPVTDGSPGTPVYVHAKVLIADDRWVRIGSANLSNRSMKLDTECDLIFDTAERPEIARRLLARLIGEHTGAGTEAAQRDLDHQDCLGAAIDSLNPAARRLEALPETVQTDFLTPALEVADPERPLEPAELARLFGASDSTSHSNAIRWRQLGIAVGTLAVIALFLQIPAIEEWLSAGKLLELRSNFARAPWIAAITILVFPLASLTLTPVTLLIAACGVVFGPYQGLVISMAGTLLTAAFNYAIGSLVGRERIRRMAGRRVNRVNRGLARQGILAVAALRLVPLAPFLVVNMVAGASHIRFRDYMLGTFLGMAPGIAVLTWVTGNSGSLLIGSDMKSVYVFLAVLGLLLAVVAGLRAWIWRREQ
jgi:phospholipase D1/2